MPGQDQRHASFDHDQDSGPDPVPVRDPIVIVCTRCGEGNPEGQTFCVAPGCGAYLVWAGSKGPISTERPEPGVVTPRPVDPAVATVELRGQAVTPVSAPVPSTPQSSNGTPSVIPRRPDQAGTRASSVRPLPSPSGEAVRGRREQVKVATQLVPTSLSVEPGAETSCETTVHNTGTIVDEYTFEVTGQPAPWAVVEPPELSLFPGAKGAVRIRFRPPRMSTTPAGPLPFQVTTTSTTDHTVSTVEAGVLEVGAFTDMSAELTPHSSHGRRSGMHELRVRNGGNVPIPVQLSGKDPDALLRFHLQPEALTVAPGAGGHAHVRAKPHHLRWLGRPQPHPFQVIATPQRGVPLTRDGIMVQDPVIPSWVPPLLALAVAAVAAVLFFLLKPQPLAVTAVHPALAVGSIQAPVTISGSNFAAKGVPAKVAFDPADGITAEVTKTSPTELVMAVTVAQGARATDRGVTVTNGSGVSGSCDACIFKVLPPTAPLTLSSVTPRQLPQGASHQLLTITGTNLLPRPTTVSFSSSGVTSVVSSVAATQIGLTVSIDATAPPGDRSITVTNGYGGTISCLCFAVPSPPTPAPTVGPKPPPGTDSPQPTAQLVPNVTGQTFRVADARLQAAGFKVPHVWEATGSRPRGAVIRTEPAVNTPAAKGSTVTMHLALGKIAVDTGGAIAVVDPADGTVTSLTPREGDSQPAWSPDGSQIAFIRQVPTTATDHLMVMNADGRSPKDLDPRGTAIDADPAWSPDGKTIAFRRGTLKSPSSLATPSPVPPSPATTPTSQLFLVSTAKADSDAVPLLGDNSSNPSVDTQPAWSPDGTRIAFTRLSSVATSQIFTIALKAGSTEAPILAAGASASQPAWSPDSKRLAFTTTSDGKHQIWLMDADDGAQRQDLTNNGNYDDDSPVWSLDGTRIAFARRVATTRVGVFTRDTRGGPAADLMPDATSPAW
jgi:Tol biopolymer transport system component